jgi:hypothetical protein
VAATKRLSMYGASQSEDSAVLVRRGAATPAGPPRARSGSPSGHAQITTASPPSGCHRPRASRPDPPSTPALHCRALRCASRRSDAAVNSLSTAGRIAVAVKAVYCLAGCASAPSKSAAIDAPIPLPEALVPVIWSSTRAGGLRTSSASYRAPSRLSNTIRREAPCFRSRRFRRCRRASLARSRPPRSACTRAGDFSTVRTATTTASRCSPSTRRHVCSTRFAGNRRAGNGREG